MKKIKFTPLLLLLLLLTAASFKKEKPAIDLTGTWEETWGNPTGEEMDINYHDQYQIRHKGAEISMTCPEIEAYSFAHIHLTGNNFTFQLTNNADPNDVYIMAYNLYVNETADLMTGTVVTNKGVEEKVELKKVN